MKKILLQVADGNNIIKLKFPSCKREIEAEILDIKLIKNWYRPIHVKILTEGITVTTKELVKAKGFMVEGNEYLEDVSRPYLEDWVRLEDIIIE